MNYEGANVDHSSISLEKLVLLSKSKIDKDIKNYTSLALTYTSAIQFVLKYINGSSGYFQRYKKGNSNLSSFLRESNIKKIVDGVKKVDPKILYTLIQTYHMYKVFIDQAEQRSNVKNFIDGLEKEQNNIIFAPQSSWKLIKSRINKVLESRGDILEEISKPSIPRDTNRLFNYGHAFVTFTLTPVIPDSFQNKLKLYEQYKNFLKYTGLLVN